MNQTDNKSYTNKKLVAIIFLMTVAIVVLMYIVISTHNTLDDWCFMTSSAVEVSNSLVDVVNSAPQCYEGSDVEFPLPYLNWQNDFCPGKFPGILGEIGGLGIDRG